MRQPVIKVTDWLIANPGGTINPQVKVWSKEMHKSTRQIWEYIRIAKLYAKELLEVQQNTKQVIYQKAVETANENIMKREEALEHLTKIAKGTVRKMDAIDEIVIPTEGDRMKAIQMLSDHLGWSVKSEVVQSGAAGTPALQVNVLSEQALLNIQKLSKGKNADDPD